jgi:RimJ/RimL family protein N-acetyltransferase
LRLRPWRVSEATIQHELWAERDDRVPPHHRLDQTGHPTVEELAARIRDSVSAQSLGLLAIERRDLGDVIGYCGLIEGMGELEGEPELAYELLRRTWGQGYATEASGAVIRWAQVSGFPRLWATVRDWNVASRRVLEKLGFVETDRSEPDSIHGDLLVTLKQL